VLVANRRLDRLSGEPRLLAQYAPDPGRLTFFALSGLPLASLMSITLIPETVSRSARAASGRGQRIGVPAAIRNVFGLRHRAVSCTGVDRP
jgi:hypothetical protein